MIVCDRHKAVFYLPPKTGARSVSRTLRRKFGAREVYGLHGARPLARPDLLHVLLVRDPFRRAVSWWSHYQQPPERLGVPRRDRDRYALARHFRGMSFAAWCADPVARGVLWPCAVWGDKAARIDRVLRTESLERDFASLPFVPNGCRLPREGASSYGDWRGRYDLAAVDFVRRRFAPDFERYGYSTEDPR